MQLIMWQESLSNVVLDDGEFHNKVIANFIDAGKLAFLDSQNKMNYFQMVNLHVHSPSEHTFDGKNFDLELHLVH